uniref:Thylakoid soluble phosphoprotein TSP9 n=1 Tax=Nelumbo nucifera TaxID=4432 RepID=A0A822YAS0_NELNU|nr:TPA_asm: hypothetical protein HUJ06_028126 [Nelumbo nucifera]
MASFTIAFAPPAGRVFAATAAKRSGGSGEEKGLLDWILGGLQKEDQLLETDPILKKVEEKNSGTTRSGQRGSVAVPPKKSGGFGGLFAKK